MIEISFLSTFQQDVKIWFLRNFALEAGVVSLNRFGTPKTSFKISANAV